MLATVGATLHRTKPDKATQPQLTPTGWQATVGREPYTQNRLYMVWF